MAKPGEHDRGDDEQEGSHNGLLQGLGEGGDAQADGRSRNDEEKNGAGEQPDGALEGDAEPEHGHQHDEEGLHDGGDHGGYSLAQQDFPGSVGSHQELVEGAFLPFPGDGEGPGQHGPDEGKHGDQAGNDEPAGDEVGVEPGAGFYFNRGGGCVFGEEFRPEVGGDLLGVAEGDGRGVRVSAVSNELERGGPPRLQIAGEVRRNGQAQDDVPAVDQAVDVFFRGRRGLPPEDARSLQVRDVLGGQFSSVLVQHGVGDAGDVHGGCVAEDADLEDGEG